MFNKLFVPLPSLNLNGILLIYFLVYFGIIIYMISTNIGCQMAADG